MNNNKYEELAGVIIDELSKVDAANSYSWFAYYLEQDNQGTQVLGKILKEMEITPPLSECTRFFLSYMLRGAIKGYGVRLDEMDGLFDNAEVEIIARELHALSNGSVDLNMLLQFGLGLPKKGD